MSSFFGSLVASLLGASLGLAVAACSSSDDGSGAAGGTTTATATCGTIDAPQTLVVKDVVPAIGSTVANEAIAHGFTVVAAPGLFKSLTLGYVAGTHTAAEAVPAAWAFSAVASGKDVRYQAKGVAWTKAPAHVAIQSVQHFQASDGCVYTLPTPLFEYDLVAAGAGGGGQGGAAQGGGGQGGSAGAGGM